MTNNITALKEEELNDVQGGSVLLLLGGITAFAMTIAAAATTVVAACSNVK